MGVTHVSRHLALNLVAGKVKPVDVVLDLGPGICPQSFVKPHGLFPQNYDDSGKLDRWGMDGGYWQTHRSGWDLEDFGEHWDFVSCPDYILLDENNQPMEKPMGAIWAFRNLTHHPDPSHPTEDRTALEFFRTILEQGLRPIAFRGLRSAWIAFLHARRRIS